MGDADRLAQLEHWLTTVRDDVTGPCTPASADASFRRYFRVPTRAGSLIAMDAPPEHEDSRPFVDIARRLAAAGLHVPQILSADLDRGFLLMTDLGDRGYLAALQRDSTASDELYADAVDALVTMQARGETAGLPQYDTARLDAELDLFPTWYVRRHLGHEPDDAWWQAWTEVRHLLIDAALAQPRVFVHRDYMPRNLMVCEPNPGILDFQDAVLGPVTYDLVSLLRDAFHSLAPDDEQRWIERYLARARAAGVTQPEEPFRAVDLMGAQRHLKVLGIFARLRHRDGKADYLADARRFHRYLARACAARHELEPLRHVLATLPRGEAPA